ncbi:MAG TPA: DUF92 domain-containing protein [Gemmatimonadales bacterium]
MSWLTAVAVAGAVAWIAWRVRTLSGDGGLAAWAVGSAVLAGTGWAGALVLATFFVPSSAISRLTERWIPAWVDAKGTRRDAPQVLANGGAALAGGVIGMADAGGSLGLWIVTTSLAAAAADTWATACGALSSRDPVDVVRWRTVPKGASGGVSIPGTLGGVLGAGLVAAAGSLAGGDAGLGWAATALGVSGMVADSVLGATVQGRFRCPACDLPSERRRHRCGTVTLPVGGVPWVSNDAVNALATALAAGGALALWHWR